MEININFNENPELKWSVLITINTNYLYEFILNKIIGKYFKETNDAKPNINVEFYFKFELHYEGIRLSGSQTGVPIVFLFIKYDEVKVLESTKTSKLPLHANTTSFNQYCK